MLPLVESRPLVLVLVGLPARGKTFMARKLARYLEWLGMSAQVFNVGNYRRDRLGPEQPAAFFDPANADGVAARHALAMSALEDLLAWLREGGNVGIYDATNVTRERRRLVRDRCRKEGLEPVFIESVCSDPLILDTNIRETKLTSPDYRGHEPDAAVADFRARIANYEKAYEPLTEADGAWVKLVDVGRQVLVNEVRGYLPSNLVFFLMNLHVAPRPIYLTRHGESEFNLDQRVGGDPGLTPRGRAFAGELARFLQAELGAGPAPQVWTSTLERTIRTAAGLPWPATALRSLDEIDAGVCDGMTYQDIQAKMPDEFAARSADKLRYRYPRGESYQDVIRRLNPVLIEIERQRAPVVIVAHNAVIRSLYAYFAGKTQEECPRIDVPLHTVIRLTPKAYGAVEARFPLT